MTYLNFKIINNVTERQNCFDILKNKSFITSEFDVLPEIFYDKIARAKYIISPDGIGTGYDCHRIYESIYLNSIAIIKRNPLSDFYEKLPVLLVDDWDSLTEEFLNNNYEKLFNKLIKWKEDNKKWTTSKYWINDFS